MKTVLVTGGCGCLGSWIIKLLIENNFSGENLFKKLENV